MNVLHFYKTFAVDQHGGVENFIRHLAHASKPLSCQSTVLSLASNPAPPLETPDYRLIQVKENLNVASTGMSLQVFSTFAKLAAEADLVHYHFPWPFMDLVHFLARTGKPSVVTYHSDIVRQRSLLRFYQPLMRAFLGSVDALVATSPNYLETSPVLARYRDKCRVIPIGLEEGFYPRPDTAAVQALQARFGPRFFLFVGVLRYYKGLHWLLEAQVGKPWPLVIAGAGPEEPALREQAQRLGLTQVHFIGSVSEQEKVDLMAACYALAFPSHLRSEAFGISLLEAAMFGKALLSCEIGSGTSFINQHEQTGLVVPPADPQALGSALARLWQSPEEVEAFGRAARQRYLDKFTAHSMATDYAQLYQSLCRQRAKG